MIGYETCMEIGIDYEDFIIKLNIHDCAGFEQYIASHLLEDYVTKYNTKRGLNSNNWTVSFKSIIKDYIDSGNSDKTTRSVYANYMYEIRIKDSTLMCLFVIWRTSTIKYCTYQNMFS